MAITPLRRVLEDEGRRQVWLAERTGINPGVLSQITRGLQPTETQAKSIAEALGRTVDELWPDLEVAA